MTDDDALLGQLGEAYRHYSDEQRRQHAALLDRVTSPETVLLDAEKRGPREWSVIVCGADRLGLLSLVTGLFASQRINIRSGDLFTLTVEQTSTQRRSARKVFRMRRRSSIAGRPAAIRRKVLDLFEVETDREVDARFWDALQEDLARLVGLSVAGQAEQARTEVVERVSQAARMLPISHERLWPIRISLDNDGSESLTKLTIESTDTLGFLFEFSNALAMLDVNIESVTIRTVGDQVRDTFWVSDARGRKITDAKRLDEIRLAAALIKQFTHLLPSAPNPAQALRQFGALTLQMLSHPEWLEDVQSLRSGEVLQTVAELMGASQFLWEDFLRMQHENLFPVLRDVPALDQAKRAEQLLDELQQELAGAEDDAQRVARLNQFKDREMFRIDLRHITRRIGFQDFSRELSALADVVVGEAARLAHRLMAASDPPAITPPARLPPWCVCALGKFGGRELGFASDIELLFIYDSDSSDASSGGPPVAAYFEEWVSTFLRSMKSRQEGIFQIDLRLRPYGKAGTLASSLDSFRKYFSDDGAAEQFERMALVKLRPVAGDPDLGRTVIELRDRFVYSGKPLDLDNIRHLRQRQASELVPHGTISAKHSPGGLVDVEYYVQAQQIMAGADRPEIRVPNTLQAIDRLEQTQAIDSQRAATLRAAYAFLRQLIDALRVVRGNARDLTLPPAESREFAYLARRLDYASAERLQADIHEQMAAAEALWDADAPSARATEPGSPGRT